VADVSVRPAVADDIDEIARIQSETWRLAYAEILPPPILLGLSPQSLAAGWLPAVESPPTSDHHVLVASDGPWRVGFAAFGPDADARPEDPHPAATAAVSVLLVEPRWGRRGHGSRLLAAVTDLAVAAGRHRLVAWVPVADTASLQFYRACGWDADGARRNLDTGAGEISELRLHTSLASV
jgi:GNAT superfamily N-acetyltransferase